MTYEEFKKELYRNIVEQEELKKRGVKVRLFEKRTIYTSVEDVNEIRAMNISYYGCADGVVREDIVCAFWEDDRSRRVMKWRVRPLYEQYKEEGWQGVLPGIIMKIWMTQVSVRENALKWEKYEEISDRLIVRPVHYFSKRRELTDAIYWRYGDIALVLHAIICLDRGSYITSVMQHAYLETWKVPDGQVLANALLNSCIKMPPRLFHANDMRSKYAYWEGVFMPGEQGRRIDINRRDEKEGIHGYRLTTNRRYYGAVALFYPGVQERIAELLGGDYFVGFTSVHEAVIHPAHCKQLNEIKAAIQHINAIFDERDMLSSRVYRYSSNRKELIEV